MNKYTAARFPDSHIYFEDVSVVGLWRVRAIAGIQVNPATGITHAEGLELEHSLWDDLSNACPIVSRSSASQYISGFCGSEHGNDYVVAARFSMLEANARRQFMPYWRIEQISAEQGISADEAHDQFMATLRQVDPCIPAWQLEPLVYADAA
jgi:hypothetical protein